MRKLTSRLRRAELRIQELADAINKGPPVQVPKVVGATVASGVYVLRVKGPHLDSTNKVVVIK